METLTIRPNSSPVETVIGKLPKEYQHLCRERIVNSLKILQQFGVEKKLTNVLQQWGTGDLYYKIIYDIFNPNNPSNFYDLKLGIVTAGVEERSRWVSNETYKYIWINSSGKNITMSSDSLDSVILKGRKITEDAVVEFLKNDTLTRENRGELPYTRFLRGIMTGHQLDQFKL